MCVSYLMCRSAVGLMDVARQLLTRAPVMWGEQACLMGGASVTMAPALSLYSRCSVPFAEVIRVAVSWRSSHQLSSSRVSCQCSFWFGWKWADGNSDSDRKESQQLFWWVLWYHNIGEASLTHSRAHGTVCVSVLASNRGATTVPDCIWQFSESFLLSNY